MKYLFSMFLVMLVGSCDKVTSQTVKPVTTDVTPVSGVAVKVDAGELGQAAGVKI